MTVAAEHEARGNIAETLGNPLGTAAHHASAFDLLEQIEIVIGRSGMERQHFSRDMQPEG